MRVAHIKPRITLSEPRSTTDSIIKDVAQRHNMTVEQLMTRCRRRSFSWARHEAFNRLYHETRLSLPSIAEMFDMHHTTVLHGIWSYRKRKAEGKVD
jgi:chromosomal replication initiation ATPase DnaA